MVAPSGGTCDTMRKWGCLVSHNLCFDREDGGSSDMKPNKETTNMLCAENVVQLGEKELSSWMEAH